jgi:hypothetical protein
MTATIDTRVIPLTCTYDVETNQMCFEWDEEANPEYNYLLKITPEELIERMLRWAKSDDAAVNAEVK